MLLPVLAAGAAAAVVWARRKGRSDGPIGGGGVATAVAFLVAYPAMTGWPRWPPIEATQRLFFMVALAAGIAAFTSSWRRPPIQWILRGIFLAVLLRLLLATPLEYSWDGVEAALWLAGLFAATLAIEFAFQRSLSASAERFDFWRALVRVGLAGGAAVALGLSGSALLGQLAGALTCGLVTIEIAGRCVKAGFWRRASAIVLTTTLVGLLLAGYFYAELGPWTALLLVAAFLLLALPGSGWARFAPLLPLALALAITVDAKLGEEEDPYGDYYGALGAPTSTSALA